MAEYIDRKRYMKEKYNCDLIHIESLELVPLYQIIDRLEQSIERSKIDKAIEEIKGVSFKHYFELGEYVGEITEQWEVVKLDHVLDILKRNIGE